MSLVEVLLAVVILSLAVVALVGGMGTSLIAADTHRAQARAEAAVRRVAEVVKGVPCGAQCPASYDVSTVLDLSEGFVAPTAQVTCYDLDLAGAACPSAGVQKVRISVTTTDPQITETVEIVKRPA